MFNRSLSSCRIIVENAFAALKQRFRQLYHFKLRNIVRMVLAIHACCILHNLANPEDLEISELPIEDDYSDPEAFDILQVGHERGKDFRDELCRQLAARLE